MAKKSKKKDKEAKQSEEAREPDGDETAADAHAPEGAEAATADAPSEAPVGAEAATAGAQGSPATTGRAQGAGSDAADSGAQLAGSEHGAGDPRAAAAPKSRPGKLVVATGALAALALIASVIAIVAVATDDDGERYSHRHTPNGYSEEYGYSGGYEDCLAFADEDECTDYDLRRNRLDRLADLIDEFAQYRAEDFGFFEHEDRERLRDEIYGGMDTLLQWMEWFFSGSAESSQDWYSQLPREDFDPFADEDRRDEQQHRFFSGRGDGFDPWLWFDSWDDTGASEGSFEAFNMCLRDNSVMLRDFFGEAGRRSRTTTTTTLAPDAQAELDTLRDLRAQTSADLAEIESAFKACESLLPDSARAWMDIDRGFFSDIRTHRHTADWSPLRGV